MLLILLLLNCQMVPMSALGFCFSLCCNYYFFEDGNDHLGGSNVRFSPEMQPISRGCLVAKAWLSLCTVTQTVWRSRRGSFFLCLTLSWTTWKSNLPICLSMVDGHINFSCGSCTKSYLKSTKSLRTSSRKICLPQTLRQLRGGRQLHEHTSERQ